ncbi:MAG: PfkB family carbohydrate kinase [Planctomycetota bacterium]|jgi:sugar/nucleoside kinase (ribokinase family)|nr:PfkB family carbohydrate kinase [Planctomycetota bacterium]
MTLTVFGSIGRDDIATPSGSVSGVVGGSAVYFSLAASLFTKVRLAANVGNDFPEQAWDVLHERGTDFAGLQKFEDQKTFHWSGSYEGDMNEAKTLVTDLNVLTEKPFVPDSYTDSELLFLANMAPETQLQILEKFPNSFVFADTMNLWIDIARPDLEKLLSKIDGLVLNDGEACMLTGEHNLIRAGAALQKMGPKYVIIKKGEHGAFLFSDDERFGLMAYPVDSVVDPTGAGDSFAGGMMGALATVDAITPRAIHRAMAYGTVCASFTVQDFSVRALEAANRAMIDARFEEFRQFLSFADEFACR